MRSTDETNVLQRCKQLASQLLTESSRRYVLAWKGSKIPRRATIDGIQTSWAQHGYLYGGNGAVLGYYVRYAENRGPNSDQQIMLIGCEGILAGDGEEMIVIAADQE